MLAFHKTCRPEEFGSLLKGTITQVVRTYKPNILGDGKLLLHIVGSQSKGRILGTLSVTTIRSFHTQDAFNLCHSAHQIESIDTVRGSWSQTPVFGWTITDLKEPGHDLFYSGDGMARLFRRAASDLSVAWLYDLIGCLFCFVILVTHM